MQITWKNTIHHLEDPNICPHCHVRVNPHYQNHYVCKNGSGNIELISIWICSNSECDRIFIGQHSLTNNIFKLGRFLNGLPKGPDWPKPIAELKSGNPRNPEQPEQTRFIKTYLQSLVAENNGLDEIAGMGFRKAIEYLVKDWAIQNKPEDKEKIEQSWLGTIIKDYFTGELKEILERATWLGNDQAHYNKLFEEYDIDVLKELIELIMVELDRQYKMRHYINSIQKR